MLPLLCDGCGKGSKGYCEMYKGQEDRQHTRIGGCAGRTNRTAITEAEFKLNPLKASKRAREVKK